MNKTFQLYRLLDKLKYTPEQTNYPYVKAILYFSLIPIIIISLNEEVYSPIYLTLACLLIGHKDIRVFTNFKQYSLRELFKISYKVFLVSAVFTIIALKIFEFFNINDPQGLKNKLYENEEYISSLLRLPFTAAGEEFMKLLFFISFFLLLSQFSRNTRIFIAVILASFIFGYMHIFNYKLTAGFPLMFSAIPTFYFMLYYRSILPLIIEHFFFDFFSFSVHTQYQDIVLFCLLALIIITMIWHVVKIPFKKDAPNTHQKT
ncbi:type II CAAX prenyl endopeptidase Rce1 family protein [Peribacillus simplex]|uniref:CPBP family glutamic-type intramembrane protease n=1 Tax=Peribacillus simplex TaxID=1478 RepID=UPI0011A4DDF9|nr:CPBP family glutamic-type intramembrane protease [Peribacillus simplex]